MHAVLTNGLVPRLLDMGLVLTANTPRGQSLAKGMIESVIFARSITGLIDRGLFPATWRSPNGATPLHWVLSDARKDDSPNLEKRLLLVKSLLAKGVNPKAQDDRGRTPLDLLKGKRHAALRATLE